MTTTHYILIITFALFTAITLFLLTRPKKKTQKPLPPIEEDTQLDATTSLSDLGYDEPQQTTTQTKPNYQPGAPRDLILFYIMPPKGQTFLGYELIQALLDVGLRHGEMGLFHHHDEQGNIVFSVAQTTQTGEFDLDRIGSLASRGLIIFMHPHPDTAQQVLETLLATAHELADDLGAQILDSRHKPLTNEIIEHYRGQCVAEVE